MNGFDPDLLSAQLRTVAEGLEQMSAGLQTVAEDARSATFRASDAAGLAEVVVDGRPRVSEVNLHPDVLRSAPDDLDRVLTTLLNEALTAARAASREALLDALPPAIRRDVTATAEDVDAGREIR